MKGVRAIPSPGSIADGTKAFLKRKNITAPSARKVPQFYFPAGYMSGDSSGNCVHRFLSAGSFRTTACL